MTWLDKLTTAAVVLWAILHSARIVLAALVSRKAGGDMKPSDHG